MQAPFEADGTWHSTMALISGKGEVEVSIASSCFRPMGSESYFRKCVIRVLERHGRTSATVAWSDATSCCYGEQLWRRCVTKKTGVCALSGQVIAAGNVVYRPKLVQPEPRNIEAMILATVLEAVSVEDGI